LKAGSKSSDKRLLEAVRAIADYQFGAGVGLKLFPEGCRVEISKRTRRPKYVYHGDDLLATIRYPDNFLALTIKGAERLAKVVPPPRLRVIVKKKAVEKLNKGMSPLPRDIIEADERILPGEEVLILDEKGALIAVGKASVAGSLMKRLSMGAVVKLRKTRTDRQT